MLHEKFSLKNKHVLKSEAVMWSLSKELTELQKIVNSKLPYYYTIYNDNENDKIEEADLNLPNQD
jgi:hypothetical protein